MPKLSEPNRDLWLWLLNDGGAWTVADLAKEIERDPQRLFDQVANMAAKGIVEKLPPVPGSRRLRYAVTGTCRVPLGMHVAEVQAQ
jgi:predicted transcriptional regulator